MKLKITIDNKVISLDEITNCTKLISKPEDREIYGSFSSKQEENPKFAYFDIEMEGKTYLYQIAGKVELFNIPVTETLTDTWEKEKVK